MLEGGPKPVIVNVAPGKCRTQRVGRMGWNGQGTWDDPATHLLDAAWIGDILKHVFRDIFWCGQDEQLALALSIEGVVTGIVSFRVHRV